MSECAQRISSMRIDCYSESCDDELWLGTVIRSWQKMIFDLLCRTICPSMFAKRWLTFTRLVKKIAFSGVANPIVIREPCFKPMKLLKVSPSGCSLSHYVERRLDDNSNTWNRLVQHILIEIKILRHFRRYLLLEHVQLRKIIRIPSNSVVQKLQAPIVFEKMKTTSKLLTLLKKTRIITHSWQSILFYTTCSKLSAKIWIRVK